MTEAEKKIREETIAEIIAWMEEDVRTTEVVREFFPGEDKIERAKHAEYCRAIRNELGRIKRNFTGNGPYTRTKFVKL